ncbi:hypothetical protein T265_01428 [Opisthorchis viverrini]|uniref:Uncharacterized protein n=1 Tax=Opisthorchis viverrini TaxID=6198 RepID=A0A075AJ07_OPIVI|nr:hypothetical protein T265_01428 [Opisthorchis viverrini]KER32554.1 hypothetical protein T265_01428 [Opisthorchis viverrini]
MASQNSVKEITKSLCVVAAVQLRVWGLRVLSCALLYRIGQFKQIDFTLKAGVRDGLELVPDCGGRKAFPSGDQHVYSHWKSGAAFPQGRTRKEKSALETANSHHPMIGRDPSDHSIRSK